VRLSLTPLARLRRIGRGPASRPLLALALIAGALALPGCATGATSDADPWEPMNRKVFWFNERLDALVLTPVALGWDAITTPPMQRAVDRFFTNLRFPIRLLNNVLQGELAGAGHETGRFVVNSTLGILGFFDPAEGWGLHAHPEDFGQTLAVWGVPSGPYLVLPLFGPSNPRDTAGLGGDIAFFGAAWDTDTYLPAAGFVLDVINGRAILLEPLKQAREASVDYYTFVRNAWLQRRRIAIEGEQAVPKANGDDLYDDSLYDDELPPDDLSDPAPDDPDAPEL
jgi:phospholipid-binding lipoprotein MlaA